MWQRCSDYSRSNLCKLNTCNDDFNASISFDDYKSNTRVKHCESNTSANEFKPNQPIDDSWANNNRNTDIWIWSTKWIKPDSSAPSHPQIKQWFPNPISYTDPRVINTVVVVVGIVILQQEWLQQDRHHCGCCGSGRGDDGRGGRCCHFGRPQIQQHKQLS